MVPTDCELSQWKSKSKFIASHTVWHGANDMYDDNIYPTIGYDVSQYTRMKHHQCVPSLCTIIMVSNEATQELSLLMVFMGFITPFHHWRFVVRSVLFITKSITSQINIQLMYFIFLPCPCLFLDCYSTEAAALQHKLLSQSHISWLICWDTQPFLNIAIQCVTAAKTVGQGMTW